MSIAVRNDTRLGKRSKTSSINVRPERKESGKKKRGVIDGVNIRQANNTSCVLDFTLNVGKKKNIITENQNKPRELPRSKHGFLFKMSTLFQPSKNTLIEFKDESYKIIKETRTKISTQLTVLHELEQYRKLSNLPGLSNYYGSFYTKNINDIYTLFGEDVIDNCTKINKLRGINNWDETYVCTFIEFEGSETMFDHVNNLGIVNPNARISRIPIVCTLFNLCWTMAKIRKKYNIIYFTLSLNNISFRKPPQSYSIIFLYRKGKDQYFMSIGPYGSKYFKNDIYGHSHFIDTSNAKILDHGVDYSNEKQPEIVLANSYSNPYMIIYGTNNVKLIENNSWIDVWSILVIMIEWSLTNAHWPSSIINNIKNEKLKKDFSSASFGGYWTYYRKLTNYDYFSFFHLYITANGDYGNNTSMSKLKDIMNPYILKYYDYKSNRSSTSPTISHGNDILLLQTSNIGNDEEMIIDNDNSSSLFNIKTGPLEVEILLHTISLFIGICLFQKALGNGFKPTNKNNPLYKNIYSKAVFDAEEELTNYSKINNRIPIFDIVIKHMITYAGEYDTKNDRFFYEHGEEERNEKINFEIWGKDGIEMLKKYMSWEKYKDASCFNYGSDKINIFEELFEDTFFNILKSKDIESYSKNKGYSMSSDNPIREPTADDKQYEKMLFIDVKNDKDREIDIGIIGLDFEEKKTYYSSQYKVNPIEIQDLDVLSGDIIRKKITGSVTEESGNEMIEFKKIDKNAEFYQKYVKDRTLSKFSREALEYKTTSTNRPDIIIESAVSANNGALVPFNNQRSSLINRRKSNYEITKRMALPYTNRLLISQKQNKNAPLRIMHSKKKTQNFPPLLSSTDIDIKMKDKKKETNKCIDLSDKLDWVPNDKISDFKILKQKIIDMDEGSYIEAEQWITNSGTLGQFRNWLLESKLVQKDNEFIKNTGIKQNSPSEGGGRCFIMSELGNYLNNIHNI